MIKVMFLSFFQETANPVDEKELTNITAGHTIILKVALGKKYKPNSIL